MTLSKPELTVTLLLLGKACALPAAGLLKPDLCLAVVAVDQLIPPFIEPSDCVSYFKTTVTPPPVTRYATSTTTAVVTSTANQQETAYTTIYAPKPIYRTNTATILNYGTATVENDFTVTVPRTLEFTGTTVTNLHTSLTTDTVIVTPTAVPTPPAPTPSPPAPTPPPPTPAPPPATPTPPPPTPPVPTPTPQEPTPQPYGGGDDGLDKRGDSTLRLFDALDLEERSLADDLFAEPELLDRRGRSPVRRANLLRAASAPPITSCPAGATKTNQVPGYATLVCNTSAYSSACSRVGVPKVTVTAAPCTTTGTLTQTVTSTNTVTSTATTTLPVTVPSSYTTIVPATVTQTIVNTVTNSVEVDVTSTVTTIVDTATIDSTVYVATTVTQTAS